MTTSAVSDCERQVVAIDGPVASGKTAVGRELAKRLGWRLFDTGIMYRAATWQALRHKVPLDDSESVADMIRTARFELVDASEPNSAELDIHINGENVTSHLRDSDVESAVPVVAAIREVRELLVKHQQDQSARGCMIVVGRDIGTVVLPDAPVKIYLDASEEVRARRRAAEQHDGADEATVLQATQRRDRRDRGRKVSPLSRADDATILDTSTLTLEQSVDAAEAIINERMPRPALSKTCL